MEKIRKLICKLINHWWEYHWEFVPFTSTYKGYEGKCKICGKEDSWWNINMK